MSRKPSFLARLFRRSAPKDLIDRRAQPADAVEPGPRAEQWLVVCSQEDAARPTALACALAARELATTLVAREEGAILAVSRDDVRVRPWHLGELRAAFGGSVDRLRVLVTAVDAQTIALARDLGELGARVAYEGKAPAGGPPGPLSYDAQTERALVDCVEDLIAVDARAARHLSSQSGGGRIVHMVPEAADEEGWTRSAEALVGIAGRPAVTVLLATGEDATETIAAVEAFAAARSDGAYRLAVVAGAHDPASDALDALEEEGQISLFRSARPGRAAAWNLGLSATRSEYVAFTHVSQRPDGAGWLRAALELLAASRDLGGVGLKARIPPGVVGSVGSRLGSEALRVGALDVVGLVAPRGVVKRAGGLVESLEGGGLFSLDLSYHVREQGLGLTLCPALGLRGGEYDAEPSPELVKEIRRRWSHRRAYLAGEN